MKITNKEQVLDNIQELTIKLKTLLTDTVKEVRAIASISIGLLMQTETNKNRDIILNELKSHLSSKDVSNVDKKGYAQGLCEIIAKSSNSILELEKLVEEINTNTNSTSQRYIREGYITLLLYLPGSMKEFFGRYIEKVLMPILNGLADSDENIREICLKCGKIIVNNYADESHSLILKGLFKSLLDNNYKIRTSSLQLLENLLTKLIGYKNISESNNEELEEFQMETETKTLSKVLNKNETHMTYAILYLLKSDKVATVRLHANQIWKQIVINNQKTIRDSENEITDLIIENIDTKKEDIQEMVSQCLKEVAKRNSHFIGSILSKLALVCNESNKNMQKICITICELLSDDLDIDLSQHFDQFSEILYNILSNEKANIDSSTRTSASHAFSLLFDHNEGICIENILQPLLKNVYSINDNYTSEYQNNILETIKSLSQIKGEAVIPIIIPDIFKDESDNVGFSAQEVRLLMSLVDSPQFLDFIELEKVAKKIINTLTSTLDNDEPNIENNNSKNELMINFSQHLFESIHNNEENSLFLEEFMKGLVNVVQISNNTTIGNLYQIVDSLYKTQKETVEIVSSHISSIIKEIIKTLDMGSDLSSNNFLKITELLLKNTNKDAFDYLFFENISKAISELDSKNTCLQHKKLFSPLLTIMLQSVVFSDPKIKEISLESIEKLIILLTNEYKKNLKQYTIQITGPLIRTIGDKSLENNIKIKIMELYSLLMINSPTEIKPFVPQLQKIIIKNTSFRDSQKLALQNIKLLMDIDIRQNIFVKDIVECYSKYKTENNTEALETIREIIHIVSSKLDDKYISELSEVIDE